MSQNNLTLQFSNLCYYPPNDKGTKTTKKSILQNLSGIFYHGHLTAILGPSGAGKTTLLNVLSGFKTNGLTGSVSVNGEKRDLKLFKRQSCYVPQDIMLLPFLTAKETLEIVADLKLDSSIGKQKKNQMVNEVLKTLGLEHIAEKTVSQLSGGEKKRLSVGQELLTNPPIMFFDEPTSGLDSASALQMILYLKSLAQCGRTVVCSIHQPSSKLFEIFDDVYLMAEGQCLYSGTLQNMTTVLGELGFQCPNYYSRSDFAIEIAAGQRGNNTDVLVAKFGKFVTEENNVGEKCSLLSPETEKHETSIHITENEDRASYPISTTWRQFLVLYKRNIICFKRDLVSVQLRVTLHLIVGVMVGILYYNMGNEATKVLSNVACIFFFIMFLYGSNAMSSVYTVPQELGVFLREHLNNWYCMKAYYLSKLLSDIPLLILCCTLFTIPGYYLSNQPTDGFRLAQFWLICLLSSLVGQSYGVMFGLLIPKVDLGLFLVPASSTPLMLFSGFFLHLKDVPYGLKWCTNISFFRYAFEGIIQCIYGYEREMLNCSEAYCYFKSPLTFMEQFDMASAVYEYDVLGLLVWYIFLQIAVFCILKWRIYISR